MLAENRYDEDDEDVVINYTLGEIKSLRAVAFSTNGQVMDAFWASKSSISYFEDVLSIDENYYDAYLGLGMFDYALSFVPGVFNWALVLTGISGDKDEGLEHLTKAYERGNDTRTEAAFHLGKIYTEYIADYQKADTYLKSISDRYPNNIMFLYQYAILKIRERKLLEAEVLLNKIIEMNHLDFRQITAFSYFLKGDLNYKQNDFEKALINYNQFIINATQVDYTGIANYRMAVCNAILGNKLEFHRNFVLAKSGNLDLPEDDFASNRSERFFEKGFTQDDEVMIKSKNLIESGRYKELLEFLRKEKVEDKTSEKVGFYNLLKSEAYLELGNLQEAIKFGEIAFKKDYEDEEWVKSYSAYILSLTYFKKNNKQEAERYLEIAENENDYQHKNLIESKINYLKKKLDLE